MMFLGSKHCPKCGAAAAKPAVIEAGKRCPRCKTAMPLISIGESQMLECPDCLGLWLTSATFEKICSDREHQATVLGSATLAHENRETPEAKINYIPCPECGQLMNRANFARCSGVIIDLCKQHGLWFDRDELSRIIEFIRGGGLDMARNREKLAIEEERRRLHQDQLAASMNLSDMPRVHESDDTRITGIASAAGLLRLLLG